MMHWTWRWELNEFDKQPIATQQMTHVASDGTAGRGWKEQKHHEHQFHRWPSAAGNSILRFKWSKRMHIKRRCHLVRSWVETEHILKTSLLDDTAFNWRLDNQIYNYFNQYQGGSMSRSGHSFSNAGTFWQGSVHLKQNYQGAYPIPCWLLSA